MLVKMSDLRGCEVLASDGVAAVADDILFDDRDWYVRYIVVDTGRWLHRGKVLLAPGEYRWNAAGRRLQTSLAAQDVASAPEVHTHPPISARLEERFHNYFVWPGYWIAGFYEPQISVASSHARAEEYALQSGGEAEPGERIAAIDEAHLRSARAVIGHHVMARDGEYGRVGDFVIDAYAWRITEIAVDAGAFWHPVHALVSTYWVSDVSWAQSTLRVVLPRERITAVVNA